jgi:two-component system, sensor histidine kinase and response regulator
MKDTPVAVSRRLRILIVEDDPDLREVFQIALSFEGYDVREARSGFEALRLLDTDPPDLVLLDLGLPGIDGYAVRQELSSNAFTQHIPVVIVTASSQDLTHLDAAVVMRKPVSPTEVVEIVRRCLDLEIR